MATAPEPGSEQRTPARPVNVALASILGAVYVLAALAAVFYALPAVWDENVAPLLNRQTNALLLVSAVLAAFVALLLLGRAMLGSNPPKGVRGGIFLVLVFGFVIFLVWTGLANSFEGGTGVIVSTVIAAFLVFLLLRLLNGRTGEGWMVGLEEAGWFSTATYKASLGQKARRITILGILLLGGTGVFSLYNAGTLPENWVVTIPAFGEGEPKAFTLVPKARFAIPFALAALTLWVAWRAVNVPAFAEFLIATEAEMNKVSWTPRKRLAQDTVVVLTTTLLLTLFLLAVDLFWGWLLSRQVIGVLPGKGTKSEDGPKAGERTRW